mmetsp:Transcript_3707/g.9020  ORF Transcript_3707/g.9020 Transcript_3707/m.9020 type:complete len:205 (+) Transcript_3707:1832-2446(+)
MIDAALLLPMPGGPLISNAFMALSLPLASAAGPMPLTCTSSQVVSHLRMSAMFLPFPMSCAGWEGLYLFTQSGVLSGALTLPLPPPPPPLPLAPPPPLPLAPPAPTNCAAAMVHILVGPEAPAPCVGAEGAAAAAAGSCSGSGLGVAGGGPHAATIAKRPSSSMSVVPCARAFVYLDLPQSVPTRRYVVRPLTADVILPPWRLM